nr:hypothetical protein [Tanacetum cinerariifolium]
MSTSNTSTNSNQQALSDLGANERPPMLEKENYIPWESQFRRFLDNKLENGERMWNLIQNGLYQRPMVIDPTNPTIPILEPLSKMTKGKERESLDSVHERLTTLMNIMDRNNVRPILMAINTKFLICLQPKWSKYVTMVHHNQTGSTVSYDVLYYQFMRFEPHVLASRVKKAAKNHDHLALIAHSNASSSHSYVNSSYSPQPYYVTHPPSVIDYDNEYQGKLQGDSQEDQLTTAMMVLVRSISQKLSTPTNNHLCISSNTRNQVVVQDGRVDIQTMNADYSTCSRTESTLGKANVQCYNCNEKDHYARECQKPKVHDSKYFREQMLLAIKDEAGSNLSNEENDFMLDTSYGKELDELIAPVMNDKDTIDRLIKEKEKNSKDFLKVKNEKIIIQHETKLEKKSYQEREDRYLDDILDLEEKLSSHDQIVYKIGQSIQTIHMLRKKPNKNYDPFLKAGMGYTNPKRLKKAIAAQPKMYDVQVVAATDDSPAVPEHITPEWSRLVTIVKQQHKMDKVSHHKLFDILNQYQKEVNELRSERLSRNANPLTLVATAQVNQDPYYQTSKSHKSYAPSSNPSIPTKSHTTTRSKGKEIAKPITPPSESASEEESDPEQAQKDKDMQKNLALIAKYFKRIYKPTNNNLRTSSNSRNKNVDTTPRYKNDNQSGQFRNQRTMNVAGARENVGSPVVKQSGIQCVNYKEFGHFAKECTKPERVKDSAYHKEKMLLCKQAEKGVPLQAEKYDWLANTDEEIEDQELEAHYSYMAKIQEVPIADSGTDSEPLEHVQNNTGYNVFANELQHYEQSKSISNTCLVEKDDSNVIPNSQDMCDHDIQNDQNDVESDDERVALANLIANLKLDVDENKKIQKQLKKENTTLSQELKECKTILAETSKTLGEFNSVRDSCLVALQNKQTEYEKYKAFSDYTVDYEKLELVKEKHNELIKHSLLTKSHYEVLVKQKRKVITDLKLKEEDDNDKMLSLKK